MYRFAQDGAFFGPESEEDMSAITRSQFLAVLADSQINASSMREYCELVAEELDQSPELAGFETWDVFEGDAPSPRFTLLYFGDSDSGLLFHAGTANPVGLALWPEGFKPKPSDKVVTGIDVVALSKACAAR